MWKEWREERMIKRSYKSKAGGKDQKSYER